MEIPRAKNVPEELKKFLMANPNEWFTNEQLADRLSQYLFNLSSTSSGIRNAVTKLKSTNLIKTKMTGSLAYRGWHTAPDEFDFPVPDTQKKMAARRCNRCSTQHSRYWRSDLEEKNGWLCNNCGMNQRRGRGLHRNLNNCSSDQEGEYEVQIAPSAEPEYFKEEERVSLDSSYVEISEKTTPNAVKRRPPYPSYVDPSKRKCGHCHTTKSAGKWRRDREVLDRYLCNKCGMNQRRAQMRCTIVNFRREQQLQQQQQLMEANGGVLDPDQIILMQRQSRNSRQSKSLPCHTCHERIPTFVIDCGHRLCGECIPTMIKSRFKTIDCPMCVGSHPVSIEMLGKFVDSLFEESM